MAARVVVRRTRLYTLFNLQETLFRPWSTMVENLFLEGCYKL